MNRVLGWLAVLGLAAGLLVGFGYAPPEAVQGNVQRIMYLHVPAIFTAYLAFFLTFVASIAYLAGQTVSRALSDLAAAALVSLLFYPVFIAIALATLFGSLDLALSALTDIGRHVFQLSYLVGLLIAIVMLIVIFLVAGHIVKAVRSRAGWDHLARSAAELGILFTGITLVSGSIWGKPTWGVWWTWDARLTSTAVLFLSYAGYLLLRRMMDDGEARARYAAIVGISAFFNIPIVHFSVYWWRTLHQPSTILGPGPAPMAPSIGVALIVNWAAFSLLFAYFLTRRMELAKLEDEANVNA